MLKDKNSNNSNSNNNNNNIWKSLLIGATLKLQQKYLN